MLWARSKIKKSFTEETSQRQCTSGSRCTLPNCRLGEWHSKTISIRKSHLHEQGVKGQKGREDRESESDELILTA